MIFVCVGSREYQFNRLLKEVDRLIESGIICEDVFEQIGSSDYLPQKCKYARYVTPEEFSSYLNKARLVITHSGAGSIIKSLNLGKKTIAVTRLKKYGEHIDDHQLQIASVLEKQGLIKSVKEMSELADAIKFFDNHELAKKQEEAEDGPSIVQMIDDFISGN